MAPVLASKIRWYADRTLSKRQLPPPDVPAIDIAVPMDDRGITDAGGGKRPDPRFTQQMGRDHTDHDEDEQESEHPQTLSRGMHR